jgi:hypothetical protein
MHPDAELHVANPIAVAPDVTIESAPNADQAGEAPAASDRLNVCEGQPLDQYDRTKSRASFQRRFREGCPKPVKSAVLDLNREGARVAGDVRVPGCIEPTPLATARSFSTAGAGVRTERGRLTRLERKKPPSQMTYLLTPA